MSSYSANPRPYSVESSAATTTASAPRPIGKKHEPRLLPSAYLNLNPPLPGSSVVLSSFEELPREIRRACCAHCSSVFLTAYSSGGDTFCGLDCR
jgi:hypothetical protein